MTEGINPKDLLGLKKTPLRLIPKTALIPLAWVMGLGAKKYGAYNWRDNPVRMSVYTEAAPREWTTPCCTCHGMYGYSAGCLGV
jgi:hypothetical protein